MNKLKIGLGGAIAIFLFLGCSTEKPEAENTQVNELLQARSTRLGFTPFPYDISSEAVEYVYEHLAQDADITAHHFDNGIPWPEAFAKEQYSQHIQGDWNFRLNNTPDHHQIFVAITPINLWRDALAPYRGDADDLPLPPPWDELSFDDPQVKTAYLNYAISVVEFFDPDYLAIGIESNLLLNSIPDQWPAYLALNAHVYKELKARYPQLPIFSSVLGVAYLDGYRDEDDASIHRKEIENLLEHSDYFAISLYPFLTRYLANPYPSEMWQQLFQLSDKPIVISETGFPAQQFSVLEGSVTVEGSPEKQAAFFQDLLHQADQRDIRFIINFVLRDYDPLYELVKEEIGDLGLLWRDTGFYDEQGNARPVLEIWKDFLERPLSQP